MPLNQHMEHYLSQGRDKRGGELVAKDRGVSKREVYQQLLEGWENKKRRMVCTIRTTVIMIMTAFISVL